jgi:DNA (cytosine-5)-methyltransferase 1
MNYYNEIDPYAAEWLRNLIKAGHIAPGFVDERSIEDVTPSELMGYTQCHFFAGIGVWSHALRSAGWPDSRPVWTGSCPCQPFSSAGKGDGFADERHLWPAFNHLIAECRPPVVIGEQVAAKAVEPWIDLVHADLEALGYTFGAIPFPSAGIGAPHIRDRMYWVADSAVRGREYVQHAKPAKLLNGPLISGEQVQQPCSDSASIGGVADANLHGCSKIGSGSPREAQAVPGIHRPPEFSAGELGRAGGVIGGLDNNNHQGLEGQRGGHQAASGWDGAVRPVTETSESGGLADSKSNRRTDGASDTRGGRSVSGETESQFGVGDRLPTGGLADTDNPERETRRPISSGGNPAGQRDGGFACGMLSGGLADTKSDRHERAGQLSESPRRDGASHSSSIDRPGPTNGFWGAADWLFCRDGKWRPVEPGTFPLAHGAASRVGRLRAYGNAINAKAAQAFIECVI